ncbi:MAG TPA: hypothetical protein VF953_06585 [Terriglobales bacterium]
MGILFRLLVSAGQTSTETWVRLPLLAPVGRRVAIRRRGNKIGFGGTFAGSRYGPKLNAEHERALQLDPNYPHAYLVMGHKYFFTPQMFGGNLPPDAR